MKTKNLSIIKFTFSVMFILLSLNQMAFAKSQIINLEVTEDGFVPKTIDVLPNTDVTLSITRKTDSTCARDVQVPSKNIKKVVLPLNKTVEIKLGKLAKGEVRFGCGMQMMESATISVK